MLKLKKKFINKIGAECEGCFGMGLPNWPYIKGDGSVCVVGNLKSDYYYDKKLKKRIGLRDGEINSPAFLNRNHLKCWVKKYFPKHVNETCGFHVHVSFLKNSFRKMLENREFHNQFIEDLKIWLRRKRISNTFKDRLSGRHDYGRTDEFDTYEGSDAIRFNTHHNTIEFRIFSMVMTPKLTQECIEFLYNYIEAYLRVQVENKLRFKNMFKEIVKNV